LKELKIELEAKYEEINILLEVIAEKNEEMEAVEEIIDTHMAHIRSLKNQLKESNIPKLTNKVEDLKKEKTTLSKRLGMINSLFIIYIYLFIKNPIIYF
jgi:predicted nuclease with TOPRIM domain